MFFNFTAATEILVLLSAISIDTLGTAFTYGISCIRIPPKSSVVIHSISSLIVVASYFAGSFLSSRISPVLTDIISFIVLMLIGTAKLFDNIIKRSLLKCNAHKKDISFSLMSLNFILSVYANPSVADADCSQTLSAKEAAILAITLSLDNFPVGIGLGLSNAPIVYIVISAIITGEFALRIGYMLGKKMSKNLKYDISWIGGVLMIILAFTRII